MIDIERTPQPDHKKDKKEKCEKVLNGISSFLFITSLMAATRCISVWNDDSATDFDLFLFFYAIVAFCIAVFIQVAISFDPDKTTYRWRWWM